MKKSSLNFLNRKSQNLFDTGVQIKHFENVELVLDSAAIPESGTAKVRSRPTVKHFNTSGDGALGFAVPTPTVPVLPPLNGPQSGNKGSQERLPNGGMISIADPEEGQILIPAPPSMAPPPPPPQFIPPSPQYIPPPLDFFGNMDPPLDLAALQPPSMPPPKPPSLTGSTTSEELDPASIKPPLMAPPKPPSETTSVKSSVPFSNPTNSAQDIPECPTFTPALPPVEKPESPLLRNAQKTPPPKPVRLSSIYNFELPPTPTPAATPASSFNPQTTAKLYSVPKTTVLSQQTDKETRTQHILLLEDSSGNPVGVHINGKASSSVKEISPGQDVVPPVKPVRRNSSGIQLEKDVEDLNKNLPEMPGTTINGEPAKVTMPQEVPNKIPSSVRGSPNTERSQNIPPVQEISQVNERPASPSKTRSYSPLLSHKLQNLRGHEGSSGKEAATSPLALLMAAKNRDKHRSGLSRQSSNKSNSSAESLNGSIQPNETKPNSFTITPIPASSESLLRTEPKLAISTEPKPQSPKISRQEPSPVPQPVLSSSPVKQEDNEAAIPFIPPPPEFANSDSEDEAPPSTPPPAPPAKNVAQTHINGPSGPPDVRISSTSALPPTSVARHEPILKQVVLSKPKAPPGQPPVQPQGQALPTVQPKFLFPAQTATQLKTQPPAPPTSQPPAPPTTQPPAPPTTQPPAPPTTQPPAPPTSQPPAPPTTQPPAPPTTQPPAPPTTQPPAPPTSQLPAPPTTQPPFPPTTQPPAPPTTQPPAPPPTKPKAQIPVPPPVQPKTQAPPPTQPKAQITVPNPVQSKTQIPVPPPVQPKTQTQAPPPTQLKTQTPAQMPASVSASQATLLSILQKKMLEIDSKFTPVKEADPNSDDWNSPLSDDDGATSFPPKSTVKPKSATLPVQTRGLDMKELENKVAKKAQNMATKAPTSNGPQSKHPYGMTFTVRPGTKQPITPVIKTD